MEEAGKLLGWSAGSVRGRLRGRARLHARLVRRGLTPAVLAAVQSSRDAACAGALRLLPAVVRSALDGASAPPFAAQLAEGVLNIMKIRLKIGLCSCSWEGCWRRAADCSIIWCRCRRSICRRNPE